MYEFFEAFIKKMMGSLRRIAAATKNEVTVDDLRQDAWVIAEEISDKRGRKIDFSDPDDESLIIRAVNHRNVKRGDWKMRKAVRIDQESDDDDSVPRWSDKLAARDSSDPLISMLFRESALNAEAMLTDSYSQAVAYVRTFVHFKNNRQDTCAYLAIAKTTLTNRVTFAAHTVRVQPSLFDCVEKIAEAFMPQRGRQYPGKIEQHYSGMQCAWDFSA